MSFEIPKMPLDLSRPDFAHMDSHMPRQQPYVPPAPIVPPAPVPMELNPIAASVYENLGRNAGMAVMAAFHNLGGVDGLTHWAKSNPEQFYTKLFPKVIAATKAADTGQATDNTLDILDAEFRSE